MSVSARNQNKSSTRAEPKEQGALGLLSLVGAGDKIGLVMLPFVIVGLALNVVFPSVLAVGGPPQWLRILSLVVLGLGLVVWAWSVALIATRAARGELITSGPYRVVKHPLYTGVALLVLPWLGFLFNTWLGLAIGIVLYLASRRFAPEEEVELSGRFGSAWESYARSIAIPWI